jgi:hypothetical protein
LPWKNLTSFAGLKKGEINICLEKKIRPAAWNSQAGSLSRPRDRRMLGAFLGGSVVFLLVSAVLSYQTYHYMFSDF